MLSCYLDGVLNNNKQVICTLVSNLPKIQITYNLTTLGVIPSYRSHAELDRDCNLVQLDIVSYNLNIGLRVIERSTD